MLPESVELRVNARPPKAQIDALCIAVGWSAFDDHYPAVLDQYSVTTSAWIGGRLIAWTSVVSDNLRHAFLLDVMVHPEFQRRGIGRQCVLRAIDEMAVRGVTAFHVDCATDRAGFYEKCGFTMGAGGWLDASNASQT